MCTHTVTFHPMTPVSNLLMREVLRNPRAPRPHRSLRVRLLRRMRPAWRSANATRAVDWALEDQGILEPMTCRRRKAFGSVNLNVLPTCGLHLRGLVPRELLCRLD